MDGPILLRGGGRGDTCHGGGLEEWVGLDPSSLEWVGLNLDEDERRPEVEVGPPESSSSSLGPHRL